MDEKAKRLKQELNDLERKGVLTGEIVGFDSSRVSKDNPSGAVFKNEWQRGNATGYVSDAQLLNGAGAATGKNYWGESVDASGRVVNPFGLPSYDIGTDYVPRTGIALVHKGERIIPAAQNASGAAPVPTTVNASIVINGMDKSPDELLREIIGPLQLALGRHL
jgi:hypothetical protein